MAKTIARSKDKALYESDFSTCVLDQILDPDWLLANVQGNIALTLERS